MMKAKLFKHLILLFFIINFSTAQAKDNAELVLQSLANVEQYHSDEGNQFVLSKNKHGCKIEARFYLSNHQILTSYIFNQKGIVSAAERTYQYKYEKGEEGSLAHVSDIYLSGTVYLDPADPETQQELNDFKALFPSTEIKKCL